MPQRITHLNTNSPLDSCSHSSRVHSGTATITSQQQVDRHSLCPLSGAAAVSLS